ncbi:MAG: N-acetylmuramoyl-L-alanine amidase [Bacteroidales bacterium]|nr:N-acetylmuramoyl-L-alanine amidase [Bacteroidales bacterium]MCM1416823.1 N-acetylmuramoyl-L-alanine amidase [bacterium]MCM1424749.1 N-acetylmuramoyl-L-alanine amidase [bacterium]
MMTQTQSLMRSTLVYCILFVAAAMSVMLYYSATKTVDVPDVAQDEVVSAPQPQPEAEPVVPVEHDEIVIDRNSQSSNYFCVPMPECVKAEEVVLENHYMNEELWVSIQSSQPEIFQEYYAENTVYGNSGCVVDGHFEAGKEKTYLRFALDGVYEYHSIFEDHILYVEFVPPREMYERVVVVDPAYGGDETGVTAENVMSKDITLNIAKALKKKFDESDVKVYYTRMDDSNPAAADRVELSTATKADMLIRLEVSGDENSKLYGTTAVYNSHFFIPGFGNVELADLLEREVVTSISGKAGGLTEATEEDDVINGATVPAAAIRVGYLTNSQEAILLQREDYIERIADGIYNAVMKSYEK